MEALQILFWSGKLKKFKSNIIKNSCPSWQASFTVLLKGSCFPSYKQAVYMINDIHLWQLIYTEKHPLGIAVIINLARHCIA